MRDDVDALDGQLVLLKAGWLLERDKAPKHYCDEHAMVFIDEDLPIRWIASVDLGDFVKGSLIS